MMYDILAIQNEFAFYGFTQPPLSHEQIRRLLEDGFSQGLIYSIGCDVEGGVSFRQAVAAAKRAQAR